MADCHEDTKMISPVISLVRAGSEEQRTRGRWAAQWVATLAVVGALVSSGGCAKDDDGDDDDDDPMTAPPSSLCLNEIMYHPVLENAFEDHHEFVEIHNPTNEAVSLDGWAFTRGIRFTFPAGTTIEPGGYLVVAKDRDALLALSQYQLNPLQVVGNYDGQLSNSGETITLQRPDGSRADEVAYDDTFPWPSAPDAFGLGRSWLDDSLLPLEQHQYLGISLERASCDQLSSRAANWFASPIDAATPGRANTRQLPEPPPVVETLAAAPAGMPSGSSATIGSTDSVALTASFSELGALAGVQIEYFVDELGAEGEPVQTLAMDASGSGDSRSFTATLPQQPANSIVRYRVLADRGAGVEVISPRPGEPYEWHAYFVSPELNSQSRLYQLFVAPSDWTRMWDNIDNGRVTDCTPEPNWPARVPGVFVYDGRVYDVQVRYHGSRFNRQNGIEIRNWPYPGPNRPDPLLALSWRVSFPRYARFEGKRVSILNKLTQGCPGYTAGVGFELYRQVGVPASHTRFVRLHVNGGYYHYTLEIERVDEDLLEDFFEAAAEQAGSDSAEPVGHLFKSEGCNCDEGPYGWGDGRLLDENCGYSSAERYAHTYDRQTHEWDTHDELIALIEGMHDARAQGTDALRSYLEQHFDLERTLSYLAVMNWSAPFDDMFQNYFLYQRRTDGRWYFIPWDLDRNFGGYNDARASLFIGEEGDRDNRDEWWNYFKDSFFQAYRDEFVDRMKELNESVLHPDHVLPLLRGVRAEANEAEAEDAPAGVDCDFGERETSFEDFVNERYQVVRDY